MADEDDIKRIPINELRQEEGADDMASSPDLEPDLNFAVALMQGNDPAPELEAFRQLPVQRRYVWRIASTLKWGFADFDDLGVDADRRAKVKDLLKLRPMQSTLVSEKDYSTLFPIFSGNKSNPGSKRNPLAGSDAG
jgi:hypothetical protein